MTRLAIRWTTSSLLRWTSPSITANRDAITGRRCFSNSLAQSSALTMPVSSSMVMKIALPVFASKDAKEGALAFAEKRAPRWTAS